MNGNASPSVAASSEKNSQSRPMINNPVAGSMNCFGNGSVSQSSQPDRLAGPSETGGNNSCVAFVFIALCLSPLRQASLAG